MSLFKRLLIRPEFGALAGAVVVWPVRQQYLSPYTIFPLSLIPLWTPFPHLSSITSVRWCWLVIALLVPHLMVVSRPPELHLTAQARSVWLSWQGTATYLDTSALYGLTALAVALLMIGGEFDLSSGVMTGTTGMFAAIFAVEFGMTFWSPRPCRCSSRRHRLRQRVHGDQVGATELHRHARHVLRPTWVQPVVHPA